MNQVDQALYEALTGDANIMNVVTGVYSAIAPPSATYPFIVFQEQSGTDDYVFARCGWRNLVYLVKCIDKSPSAKRAGEVYDLINAALHDASLSVPGHAVLYIRRESDVKYAEVSNGVMYWHVGARYRITVAPE